MKYTALLLSILLLISCNDKKIVVKGQIENCPHQYIYLSQINVANTKVIDSCELDNSGNYKFKLEIDEPTFLQLHFIDNKSISLLVHQGEKIKIHSNFNLFPDDCTIEGSIGSFQIQKLTLRFKRSQQLLDSLRNEYAELSAQNNKDTILDQIAKAYVLAEKLQHDSTVRFIIQNIHSMANIYAIYQKYNDGNYVLGQIKDVQYIKIVSDTLHKYYPKSNHVKALWIEREKLIGMLKQSELNSFINQKLKEQEDSLKNKK